MSPAVKQSYSASSNEYTSPEQSSLLTKITNFIGQNSLIVLGLLIVSIIIIGYLYAEKNGWFGLGNKSSQMKSKKKKQPSSEDDIDEEIDKLADSINLSQDI